MNKYEETKYHEYMDLLGSEQELSSLAEEDSSFDELLEQAEHHLSLFQENYPEIVQMVGQSN